MDMGTNIKIILRAIDSFAMLLAAHINNDQKQRTFALNEIQAAIQDAKKN